MLIPSSNFLSVFWYLFPLCTIPVPPSPPQDLTVSRSGLTAVTLSWNVPESLGNAVDVDYEIMIFDATLGPAPSPQSHYRTDNRSHIHVVPPSGRFAVVSNLRVNTPYGFLVVCKNEAGLGKPSDYVQTQTLPDSKYSHL